MAIGAAGFWYYSDYGDQGNAHASGAESTRASLQSAPEIYHEPIYYDLEPFTVTLSNARVLHVGLSLRLRDHDSAQRIDLHLPEFRSRIIQELASMDQEKLKTKEGREDMLRNIAIVSSHPFQGFAQGQSVTNVLITAFVIQ